MARKDVKRLGVVPADRWEDRGFNAGLPPRERTVTLPAGLPEFTLGYGVLAWIERNLRVPDGPYAGQRFECSLDQALFLLWWYAVDSDGRWLVQQGVRRLGKGSGKSPFAAAMALAELLGPVRVSHFDESVPGGVVGMPVAMPLIQLAATSMDQTGVTMRSIRAMANKQTTLAKKYKLDPGKTYIETPTGGKLQVLTSSATSAEGHAPTFVIADETEHWTPSAGGTEMFQVLKRNLAKQGNRVLETCNAWVPGQESVAEKSFEAWCAQEEGMITKDKKTKILYDARVAPANTVLHDQPDDGEVSLTDSLRFIYKYCPWVSLDAIKDEIWTPTTPVSVSRRFFLNQPNTADDAWVTLQQWSVLADPKRELVDGEDVVLFFDGSKSNDHTALVGCCMADGHIFTVGVWQPSKRTGVVDAGKVDSAVRRSFERFNVLAFYGDVREWESYVKDSWANDFGEDLLLPAVKQGKAAAPIAWDMRSHGFDFAVAAEMCKAEIEDKKFTHDGNWDTSRHVGNCRMVESRGHITVKKESPKSPNKIDAAVCVIGARMAYRNVKGSKEYEKYLSKGEDWTVWL